MDGETKLKELIDRAIESYPWEEVTEQHVHRAITAALKDYFVRDGPGQRHIEKAVRKAINQRGARPRRRRCD